MELNIQKAMDMRGISRAALARETGLSYRTVEDLIKRGSGNIKSVAKVAQALDMTIDELLTNGSEAARPPPYLLNDAGMENLPISELPEIYLYKKVKELEQKKRETNPEMSQAAAEVTQHAITRFNAYIRRGNDELANGDKQAALETMSNAFLAATTLDMNSMTEAHVAELLALCRELADTDVVTSLTDKFTATPYNQHLNHLVVFAEQMDEAGYEQEAEQFLITISSIHSKTK